MNNQPDVSEAEALVTNLRSRAQADTQAGATATAPATAAPVSAAPAPTASAEPTTLQTIHDSIFQGLKSITSDNRITKYMDQEFPFLGRMDQAAGTAPTTPQEQAAYDARYKDSTLASVGHAIGETIPVMAATAPVGVAGGAAVRALSAARPLVQSGVDLASGALQGYMGAKMTGGDPVAGALSGGGLAGTSQLLGLLRLGLEGKNPVARAITSKVAQWASAVPGAVIGDAIGGVKGAIIGGIASPAAHYVTTHALPGVLNVGTEALELAKRTGIPGAIGSLAGNTVNYLMSPPGASNYASPSVSGLLPQQAVPGSGSPTVNGLIPGQ